LTLFGDPQKNPEYFSILQEIAGSDERIRFAGTFPNEKIAEIFSEIDLLVIPSLWYENTPLVLYSALATKTPVLVSNIGSLAEVVSHGQNGLLFKVGDSMDLGRQIESVLNDPSALDRLRQGIAPVKSMDQNLLELLEIYAALSVHPAATKPAVSGRSLAKWLAAVRGGGVVNRVGIWERIRLLPALRGRGAMYGDRLELCRCQYASEGGGQLTLRFVWRTSGAVERDVRVVVDFLVGEERVFRSEHLLREFIGRKGLSTEGIFAYSVALSIPHELPGHAYGVRLGLWDPEGSGFVAPTKTWGWHGETGNTVRLRPISLQ
jgi:hypothetical protein